MLEALMTSKGGASAQLSGFVPQPIHSVSWPGIKFTILNQDLSKPSVWSRKAKEEHTVTVFLDGSVDRMEMELQGTGLWRKTPMVGEVCVFPAHEWRGGVAFGKSIHFAEMQLDPNLFSAVTGRNQDLPPIRPQIGQYDDFLHKAARQIDRLIRQPDDMAMMLAQSLAHTIYLHVFREYTDRRAVRGRSRPELSFLPQEKQIVREFIEENLHRPLSLHQLALLVGMKLHPFMEAFRESYGMTPAQYIIEQRLRLARRLLATTKSDITSIAFQSGFANHGHMTNAFRTRLGITPKEFREARY